MFKEATHTSNRVFGSNISQFNLPIANTNASEDHACIIDFLRLGLVLYKNGTGFTLLVHSAIQCYKIDQWGTLRQAKAGMKVWTVVPMKNLFKSSILPILTSLTWFFGSLGCFIRHTITQLAESHTTEMIKECQTLSSQQTSLQFTSSPRTFVSHTRQADKVSGSGLCNP